MKSIALIVDVKNWAFDIQAKLIKNSLKDVFKIDIFYSKSETYNDDVIKILEDVKDYDIIHFFWRKKEMEKKRIKTKKKKIKKIP